MKVTPYVPSQYVVDVLSPQQQPENTVSDQERLSHDQQAVVDQQNKKTGGNYDIDKEYRARNAQTVIDLLA